MKIIKVDLNKNYKEAVEEAVQILRLGGVVVYPTDTVYGLGANACDSLAVDQVFKIKKRSYRKPLPVLARNQSWLEELVYLNGRQRKILEKIWPGKVTAILPRRDYLSKLLNSQDSTVGIRIADFPFVDYLLGRFGYPLTATSANLSGAGSTNDADKIIECFERSDRRPDLILDAGLLPKSEPSTVLDLTSEEPRILRIGPSRPDQLLRLLDLTRNDGRAEL